MYLKSPRVFYNCIVLNVNIKEHAISTAIVLQTEINFVIVMFEIFQHSFANSFDMAMDHYAELPSTSL